MATPSDPPESVPSFVVERFVEHDRETLESIVDYVDGAARSRDVPDYVVDVVSLQDDETVAAIAGYAEATSDFLADCEAKTIAEAEAAIEAEGDDNDGTTPGFGARRWR